MDKNRKVISREEFRKRIAGEFKLDLRYSVLEFADDGRFLVASTDSLSTAKEVSSLYERVKPGFRLKVILLPDGSAGKLKRGICHVGVAPVRKSGASASEQVTQILFGESFDTLQIGPDWIRVRLHEDGYVGWVSANQVTLFDDSGFQKYKSIPVISADENVVRILGRPERGGATIREAVLGSRLSVAGKSGKYVEVILPDGIKGWVEKSKLRPEFGPEKATPGRIVETARRFLGISYVWGGRSANGFDCSGFVQTVFRQNGVELPRDADMQYSTGTKLGKNLKKLRAGDLLFFSSNGHKITHVAIYTGKNSEIIHSSGFVRLNSLVPNRKNYSRKLSSAFVGACRVI